MFITLNQVGGGRATVPLVVNVNDISGIWPYNMGQAVAHNTTTRTSIQMSNGSTWNVTDTMEEITAKLMMI